MFQPSQVNLVTLTIEELRSSETSIRHSVQSQEVIIRIDIVDNSVKVKLSRYRAKVA
jgi:hypothetical protein